jgi:hypothetical protein
VERSRDNASPSERPNVQTPDPQREKQGGGS